MDKTVDTGALFDSIDIGAPQEVDTGALFDSIDIDPPAQPKIGAGERLRLNRKAETGVETSTLAAVGAQATLGVQPIVDVIQTSALQQLASGKKKTFFRGEVPFSDLPDYEVSNMAKFANLDMPFMDSALKYWDKTKGAEITDAKQRKLERTKFMQSEATNELKVRLQNKIDAGQELSKRDQTLWAKIAGSGVENAGYTGAFMRGGVGAVGTAIARRFGDLQNDEQTLVDGEIHTVDTGDTQGTAAAKGAAGGSAEYAIEKYGTEIAGALLKGTVGRIPGVGAALAKMGGTAAGKVIVSVARKFNKLGEITGKQNLAGEMIAEELPQQLLDAGVGLDKRESAKLLGMGSDTKQAASDFFKPQALGDMALGFLLMQTVQGSAASASYYNEYSKDRNAIDGTLAAFGADPDLLKKASMKDKRDVLDGIRQDLTPDKATAILGKLGDAAGALYKSISEQEGYDFDAQQNGIVSKFQLPPAGSDNRVTLPDGSLLYDHEESGIGIVEHDGGTATVYDREGDMQEFQTLSAAVEAANKLSVKNQVIDLRRSQKAKYIETTARRLASGVNVQVHNTSEDLMQAVPEVADSPDFMENPAGIAVGDTIHVVLDNINTPRGAVSVILHEAGAHAGLGRILKGDAKNQFLSNLGGEAVGEYKAIAKKLGYVDGDSSEEALAYMYQSRLANPTGFQKGVKWIHDQLRKVNPDYNFTDSDIEVMMADAQQSVRASGGAVTMPGTADGGKARDAAYLNAAEGSYEAAAPASKPAPATYDRTEAPMPDRAPTVDLASLSKANGEADGQLWTEAMRTALNDVALADQLFQKWRSEDAKEELDNATPFENQNQQEGKPNVQFHGNKPLRRNILAEGMRQDGEGNPDAGTEVADAGRKPRKAPAQPDDNRGMFSQPKKEEDAETAARALLRGDRLQRRMDQLSEQSKDHPEFKPIVSIKRTTAKIEAVRQDNWGDMSVEERRTLFDLRDILTRENAGAISEAVDMFVLDLKTRPISRPADSGGVPAAEKASSPVSQQAKEEAGSSVADTSVTAVSSFDGETYHVRSADLANKSIRLLPIYDNQGRRGVGNTDYGLLNRGNIVPDATEPAQAPAAPDVSAQGAASPNAPGAKPDAPGTTGKAVTFNERMKQEYPPEQVPVSDILVNAPGFEQFKKDADPVTGEVSGQELRGSPFSIAENPIVVMELNDGRKVVVTGRHRLALYKRSGKKTIPAHVIRESDGWTPQEANTVDAFLNIIDQKGTLHDYIDFLDRAELSEADARRAGILDREQGRAAWSLHTGAGQDLRAATDYTGDRQDGIRPEQAAVIARIAPVKADPRNESLQRLGIKKALGGMKEKLLADYMRVITRNSKGVQASGEQGDFFDAFGDTFLQDAEKEAKYISGKIAKLTKVRQILSAAVNNPESLHLTPKKAEELGIRYFRDVAGLKEARDEIDAEISRWSADVLDSALVEEARRGAGLNVAEPVQTATVSKPDAPIFDDEYKGKRFTYGLQYRPMQIGAQPKGFIIGSQRDSVTYRHGTIDYPRQLTAEEVKSFELVPVDGEVEKAKDASLFDEGALPFNLDGGEQADVERVARERKAAEEAEAARKLAEDSAPTLFDAPSSPATLAETATVQEPSVKPDADSMSYDDLVRATYKGAEANRVIGELPQAVFDDVMDAQKEGVARTPDAIVKWLKTRGVLTYKKSPTVAGIIKNLPLADAVALSSEAGAELSRREKEKNGTKVTAPKPQVKTPTANLSDADNARLAEIQAKLRQKLRGQANMGFDPEILTLSGEMAILYAKGGIKTFSQFAGRVKSDMADLWEQMKQYLHSAWQAAGAADETLDDVSRKDATAVISALDNAPVPPDNNPEREAGNEPDSSSDMAEGGRPAQTSDVVGGSDVQRRGRGNGAGNSGRGQRGASDAGRSERVDSGVSDGVASDAGSAGDQRLPDGATAVQGRASGSAEPAGSYRAGIAGMSDDDGKGSDSPSDASPRDAGAYQQPLDAGNPKARREVQSAADRIVVVRGDESNIAATLPLLMKSQQRDVLLAEQRFAKPDGFGMMFTNGTGTGKTYTGMGIVKRYVRDGRDSILIVAPNQEVINGWIKTGADLGIPISQLGTASENGGKGVVVTTYSNLGMNETLADRSWDLVVADESQNLLSKKDSDVVTLSGAALRAVTLHPRGATRRARMLHRDLYEALEKARIADKLAKGKATVDKTPADLAAPANYDRALVAVQQAERTVSDYVAANQGNRPRVVFLSATPFAYVKNIDYAEGYLFDYGKDEGSRGYNQPSAQDRYLMSNFGYSMRYNRLEAPGPDVNSDVMERQWSTNMTKSGAVSGRRIDIKSDYERRFALTEDSIGTEIDNGMKFLREADKGRFMPLHDYVQNKFSYLPRMYLLESLKARHAVPIIRQWLKQGNKVVVFHDYNQGGGFNPFSFDTLPPTATVRMGDKYVEIKTAPLVEEFFARNPAVASMDFTGLSDPITAMLRAFPGAGQVNGTRSGKQIAADLERFNNDESGPSVIIVQAQKGGAGISLHDTTGKHPRREINLGLPSRPVTAIQEEGRIYRVGQHPESNALFLYMNTGTNWEAQAFARKMFERGATAENLAMGEQARRLRQSYVEGFRDSAVYSPSQEDGRGGKQLDTFQDAISDYERAKTFYFGRQKKTARDKSREGADYYATPEPLGMKMVEWANVNDGESILEPSAGHGAISRFFPEMTKNTIVEPSNDLYTQAVLLGNANTKAVRGTFEDLDIHNKFDAITMNPPFGVGGKTAVEHLAKAFTHLRDGGRIVAIIPQGPTADKRFDAWIADQNEAVVLRSIGLPSVTFERAGTSVKTRVVIIDRYASLNERINAAALIMADIEVEAQTVKELFDMIEDTGAPDRIPVEKKQPSVLVTGGRAAVLPIGDGTDAAAGFDNINDSTKAKPDIATVRHTKKNTDIFILKTQAFMSPDKYKRVAAAAKSAGGWYSRKFGDSPAGFAFETMEAAEAFAGKNADVFLAPIRYSVSLENFEKAKAAVSREKVANSFRALPSKAPKAREMQADVQVSYAYNLTSKTVQQSQDEARGIYEKSKATAQLNLLSGYNDSGDINTDARRMALDKIAVDDLTVDAVTNPDDENKTATAMLGIWRWYERGTDVARALRLRFDPVDTPEGRRAWLLRTILAPTKSEGEIISKAETTAAAIDRLKKKAKLARAVMAKLKSKGIDVSALTAEQLMDDTVIAEIMREISTARSGWGDMVHEWWRNAILSAPTTQIVNTVGNAGNAALEAFIQRPVEALMNTIAKNDRAASFNSIRAMNRAIVPSLGAANAAFLKSWATEKPVTGDSSKIEESGAAIPGQFGKFVRIPQRTMTAVDEWFKTVFMAMLTADYATREFERLVKSGDQKEANREDYLLAQVNPLSASYAKAWDDTLRWSFQQKPGHMAGAIMNWRNDPTFGFWLKFIFPFVKTPANIISTGLRKTPLNALPYIYKSATGKYSKEEALRLGAEQAVGMVLMSVLYAMMQGDDDDPLNRPRITGSRKSSAFSPKGAKEAEMQDAPPMSIRVGDKWIRYSRLEPFATMVSAMVDALTAWDQAKAGNSADIPATVFASIRGNLADKTFLQGVGNLVSIMEGDEFAMNRAITGTLAGFNPNIIRSTVRAFDPYIRETRTKEGGAVKNFAVKLSYQAFPAAANAPAPKIDKAGKEIEREGGGLYNTLAPFAVQSADKTTKVDAMVKRYNESVPSGRRWWPASPLPADVSFGKHKIRMTDDENAEYKRIAGEIAARRLATQRFNYDAPTERDIERLKVIYEDARAAARGRIRTAVIRRWKAQNADKN